MSRADLVRRITGSDRPLAVVTAPAGYGKTTLLAELAATDDRDVVWLSLEPAHEDPVGLAKDLAAALAVQGLVPQSLVGEIRGPITGSSASAVSRLGRALMDAEVPFVLIVDDAHLASASDGSALLDGLVDHVPTGSQLVVAGRMERAFVSRRRVSAEVVQVDACDLKLSPVEVRSVYEAAGLTISPVEAGRIAEHTEGWAAAVYLSALVADGSGDAPAGPHPVRGSSPYLADYLLHHVLDGADTEIVDFLLDSALLDHLQPALCDAALQIDSSAGLLRRLEQSNLFVAAVGEGHETYRLHALFRQFLLAERDRRRSPAQAGEILQRAAAWCEDHGDRDRAVEYLLNAQDAERLGPVLAAVMQPAFDQGRTATVARWLREAGPSAVDGHPPLAVLAGWFAALTGHSARAEELAARLADLRFDGPTADGWSSFDAARAGYRALLCAGGVAAMMTDAERAVDGAPPWSPWRSTALWLLGQAHELAGDRDDAAGLYDDAVRADVEADRPPLLVAIVSRALQAIDEADWAVAADRVERALRRTESIVPELYLAGGMAHVAAAGLSLHQHDRDRAEWHLAKAMASRPLATYVVPHRAVRFRAGAAALYATLGDRSTAARLVDEIDVITARRPELGTLLEHVARVRRLLAPDMAGATLTPGELRVLTYLPTHLGFAEIGEELFLSRHTVHTHAGSIYRKFGATSRSEAVERARDLGLLPEFRA